MTAADVVTERVAVIRSTPLEQLASPEWLENTLLPHLGFAETAKPRLPEHLGRFCGTGLGSFQSPAQFSRYLCFLSNKKISTYLEIGTFHGGTFIVTVEYLSRFHPISKAMAVDRVIQDGIVEYAQLHPAVRYLQSKAGKRRTREGIRTQQWDLAMVDAGHSFEDCWLDYTTVRDVARIIALHDTDNDLCPGVEQAWLRLRDTIPSRYLHEFHDQYPELGKRYFGIGVVDWTGLPDGT